MYFINFAPPKSENFDDPGIWWMKWLKNAVGQSFMQLFLHTILFGGKFIS